MSTNTPQLPLEIWCKVVKYLGEPRDGDTFSKGDLCAVARVNSITNAAASSLIYENVRIFDFDAFFLGFNHTPTALRQSKAHWLTKTKSIAASCWRWNHFSQIGPVMAQILIDDNHYERLVGVLPNLIKLRLFSTIHDTMNVTPLQLFSSRCWSHLSLPAKYLCRGASPAPAISMGAHRPEPYTIIYHDSSRVRYERTKSSTVDQIIIPITVEVLLPGQACPHNDINDYILDFKRLINRKLEGILSILETGRERFVIRLYGWFESCECGGTRKGFAKVANDLKFINWHLEFELPLDINFEFFPRGDVELCQVCGE